MAGEVTAMAAGHVVETSAYLLKVVSPCSEKVIATARLSAAVAAAASTSLRWTDRRVELVLLLAAQR